MTKLEKLSPDFRDLLIALSEESAEFLIVGAYALALHGVSRSTGDIDLLIRPTPENAARVWRALVHFGAPVASAGLTEKDLAAPGTVFQIGLPPYRIDLLTEISGVPFEEAWATRERTQLENTTVSFIGREAFVRNKLASGRPKDLADARRLVPKK